MSNRRSTRALVPASRRRRGVAARLLALAMAVTLARIPLSAADPADIQAVPAPQLGSDPPKATPIGAGDASVSTSTGALTYSYPITAPAGRHDLAPALALTYSSQGAIYGGLAAGWSLDLPFIEEDGDARHRRHLTTAPQHQVESPADDVFVSGLAGGRRLLPTSEAAPAGVGFTYRADRDSSQLRYQRMDLGQSPAPSFHWRVQAPDGTSHYFGDAAFITQPGSTALRAPSAWKVPLTRTVDPFGNTVEYHWKYDIDVDSQEGQEYRIDKIRYTSNPSAGQGHHAEVSFVWSRPTSPLCNRWVGLQLDFRLGSRWAEGTYQLDEVVAKAVAPVGGAVQHTRTITLGYDARTSDCNDPFTPYRQLTSISERAVGASTAAQPLVVLPTVTFGYGSAEVRRVVAKPVSLAALPKLASGTRGKLGPGAWPGVESMLLDFDGDGRPDLLEAKHTDPGQCQMTWKRNLGSTGGAAPTFAAAQTLTLPRLPWGGTTMGVANPAMGPQEGCFLNFQLTNYWNKADNVLCEAVVNGTPAPHNMYKQPTYLAYRWVDMNADGRPDLVTAIHHDPFYFDPSAQPWFGSYPACGSTGGACPMVPDACMATAVACNDPGKVCSWNDPVLRGCVDPAPTEACGLMGQRDNTWVPPGGPPTLEVTDDDPPASSDCPPTEQVGHKLACKEYPWFVYWNNGNGQLNPNPEIKLQPGPLESDSGDSSFGGSSGFAAGKHALQDFDGDGTLDLAMSAAHANTIAGEPSAVDAQYWLLFPGTRTGGFERASNGKHVRFEVLTRPGLPTSGGSGIRIGGTNPRQFEATTAGQIIDLNGDGLPDYVGYIANAYRVFYGDGGRMRMIAGGSGGERDLDLAGAFLSSSLTVATTGGWTPPPVAAFQLDDRIKDGSRYATHRLIDLDADGRPDHVSLSDLNALPVIRWNIGDGFLGTSTTGSADLGRALRNKATLVDGTTPTWSTSSDLVDLDGDGLSEIVDLAGLADGANRKVHDLADPASGGAPPRLLRWIGNGRGATTTVSYAAMTDATVVLMDPAATPNPKVSPNAQWVVSALTTTEQLTALPQSATTSTVSYRYDHPRYGADNDGKRGFRGFEQTRTIGPTGAVSVDRFAYDIDKTGLKTMTLVYPSPNIGTPGAPSSPQSFVHAIDETTYNEMVPPVLGVKVVLPTTTRKRLCQPNQTEAQCLAAPASLVKTASTWTGLSSSSTGGPALLYAMTQQRVQSAEAQAPTDRIAVTDYYLAADGDLFRLRTTSTHADTGAGVTFARTVTTWDTPLYRAPVTQEVWFDQNGSGRAITRFDVDALGNVRKRWKPEQEAAGPPAVYEFDPSGRFVTHEVNEVGHDFVTTYEPGTGAVVSKQGTNFRTCDVTANCPALWQRVRDEVWTKVDGVGRPLEQRETYANGTTYYLEYLTKTWSYTEPASSCVTVGGVCTAPPVVSAGASVTERSLIEWTETRFAETRTELDGHGRPLRSTAEAGTNDAVSSFAYDSAGKLIRVRLPNPALAAGTPGTVDYRYGFDSLGRPVSMRRPDAAEIDQSGVDVAYAGLVETRSDVAGAGGGAVGKTRLTRDAFGRLTQVEELRSIVNNVEAWATTEYQYDPADRVVLVREVAEDVQTSMVHDWGGRRTRISRSGRNWDFVYDRNGNVLAEVAPPDSSVPGQAPSAQDIARWTTTFVYDAHDRPISKVMAQRAIPDTLKATLGIGTWTYQWDLAGMNRKGQLYLARLMIPGTNVPYFSDSFGYDAQGNITAHNDRTWFGHVTPGGAQPTTAQQPVRAFGEHFTPGGQSRRVIYGDWLATDGTNNGQYTQS
nr:hypothetical protein [Kofleriaceae bacterium]